LRTGQLTLDDTADLVQGALDGQQARRDWILANWPHVVEYQEIDRTLTNAMWGPDPHLLTDLLTKPLTDSLTAAIHAGRPWLRAALCAIADRNSTALDDHATAWLEDQAASRVSHILPTAVPVGDTSPNQLVPLADADVGVVTTTDGASL
jgi:hypothetical protein